jgi:hypothetical protein
MTATTRHFTASQATDEALLLFIRKVRRLHPAAFGDVWAKLPDGAKQALAAAEMRADVLRDTNRGLTWQPDPTDEDDGQATA